MLGDPERRAKERLAEEGRATGLKTGPCLLITFTTYRRRPVFASTALLQVCADALSETSGQNGYRVYALAIMPDHVHLVLDSGRSRHRPPRVLNNLKGVASRRVFQASPELKLDLRSDHLWTDEYQAKWLPSVHAVERACDYVEQNPIKLGFPRQRYSWVQGTKDGR